MNPVMQMHTRTFTAAHSQPHIRSRTFAAICSQEGIKCAMAAAMAAAAALKSPQLHGPLLAPAGGKSKMIEYRSPLGIAHHQAKENMKYLLASGKGITEEDIFEQLSCNCTEYFNTWKEKNGINTGPHVPSLSTSMLALTDRNLPPLIGYNEQERAPMIMTSGKVQQRRLAESRTRDNNHPRASSERDLRIPSELIAYPFANANDTKPSLVYLDMAKAGAQPSYYSVHSLVYSRHQMHMPLCNRRWCFYFGTFSVRGDD